MPRAALTNTLEPEKPAYDAGTELRRRLGLSEPSYVTHPKEWAERHFPKASEKK